MAERRRLHWLHQVCLREDVYHGDPYGQERTSFQGCEVVPAEDEVPSCDRHVLAEGTDLVE